MIALPAFAVPFSFALAVAAEVPCAPRCTDPARCVVIDPGHPSEVSAGTHPINGISERDINWIVSRGLQRRLTALGVEAMLTRADSAEAMTNLARAEFANCAAPALFLRLHADAAPSRGFTVYHADRAGRAHGVVGPQASVRLASAEWAVALERAMQRVLAPHGIPSRGVRPDAQTAVGATQGALTGSIVARVPTVLVEMVVLTDERDARFIRSAAGQQVMIEALLQGLMARIETNRRPRTPTPTHDRTTPDVGASTNGRPHHDR